MCARGCRERAQQLGAGEGARPAGGMGAKRSAFNQIESKIREKSAPSASPRPCIQPPSWSWRGRVEGAGWLVEPSLPNCSRLSEGGEGGWKLWWKAEGIRSGRKPSALHANPNSFDFLTGREQRGGCCQTTATKACLACSKQKSRQTLG